MKTVRLAPGGKEDGVETPSFTAKVWSNPEAQRFLATPTEGPLKDRLYGEGDSEAEALDDLAAGMAERGL